ncbi:MAG: class A beta-lactamase-related serine hydrolase [Phenylobacterium sp.]|nr:MAG: class A beta-lactamase-related serine hydrolase [Phenylobacterium sp.]
MIDEPFQATTRRAWLKAASAGLTLPALALAAPARSAAPADPIQSALEALVRRGMAPGISLSVREAGRTTTYTAGLANIECEAPLREDSVFRIGSITKQFTAAAILRLKDQGALSLTDSVAKFIPRLPSGGGLTIDRLLTHTSGLEVDEHAQEHPGDHIVYGCPDGTEDPLEHLETSATIRFGGPPGTAFRYSNLGFAILARIVEVASSKTYAAFLQDELTGPLGLARTAEDDSFEVVPGRVAGYEPMFLQARFQNAAFLNLKPLQGAASLRSTGPDLCLWHEALLAGRVLRPETLQLMLTPTRLKDGALAVDELCATGRVCHYGAGLELSREEGGPRYIGHGGQVPGFAVVQLTQRSPFRSVVLLMNNGGGFANAGVFAAEPWGLALRVLHKTPI